MKSTHFALTLTLLLAIASNLPADARPMGHFGTSSSFKSGFSSQKGNAFKSVRPSAPAAAPKNGPGAFGAAAASDAGAKSNSAMSRDLDQSAAQANATRTLDARRAAASASAVPPVAPFQGATMRPQPGVGQYASGQQYYQQPMPQPVYVQRHDSGWMPMFMGFMIGRSLGGGHQTVYYNGNNGNDGGNGGGNYGNGGYASSGSSGTDNGAYAGSGNNAGGADVWNYDDVRAAQAAAAPAAHRSGFGETVLRVAAWLALLSTMFWVLRVIFKRMLRNRAAPNYSFERN